MRIVFMGTSQFAVPTLGKLIDSPYEVVGIVTQPDRPKGRGNKVAASPVKEKAISHDISVFQPARIKALEAIDYITDWQPDLIVVVAYGQIIPPAILQLPSYGCINVHASLLPKYRGAAPIQRCLMNGEKKTGVTTMFMDEGLDTGDILLQQEVIINDDTAYGELHDHLAAAGADLLMTTIKKLKSGTLIRRRQNDDESTYAAMITKTDEFINWQDKAEKIFNQIRALNPQPGASTLLLGETLKIFKSRIVTHPQIGDPGVITAVLPSGFIVQTGDKALEILEVQKAGKKRIDAPEFLKGHCLSAGIMLGKGKQE
ncbi:MAG TPA: methionyl-tRNA formyltransferase [Syntrophomonadaceae bacterium]|nr:methionyl-tRNA formyltransferase [Syntrophomonadaceae bacterium]HNX29007.1 methionyl-tRNA formyltransferase [Syntrophomonadaceae bacterium]HPR93763.1 methionyl-tRNA formyltransferase [Syntrophomonadaceae bacterium]